MLDLQVLLGVVGGPVAVALLTDHIKRFMGAMPWTRQLHDRGQQEAHSGRQRLQRLPDRAHHQGGAAGGRDLAKHERL